MLGCVSLELGPQLPTTTPAISSVAPDVMPEPRNTKIKEKALKTLTMDCINMGNLLTNMNKQKKVVGSWVSLNEITYILKHSSESSGVQRITRLMIHPSILKHMLFLTPSSERNPNLLFQKVLTSTIIPTTGEKGHYYILKRQSRK